MSPTLCQTNRTLQKQLPKSSSLKSKINLQYTNRGKEIEYKIENVQSK